VLLLLSELGLFVADETMLKLVMLMKRQITILLVVDSSGSININLPSAFINTKVIGLTSLHVSNGAELEPRTMGLHSQCFTCMVLPLANQDLFKWLIKQHNKMSYC
jgi:hypothetical protein